ncbi:MAG: AMP-binding protein, partial [Alphaproteobacteria bacterium]|nr:AMP-binding protein [Alphaproteobacteria bacterium]
MTVPTRVARIEAALRYHGLATEACVLERRTGDDPDALHLFASFRKATSLGEINAFLQDNGVGDAPIGFLTVLPALPHTREGAIDRDALLALPYIDTAVLDAAEDGFRRAVEGAGALAIAQTVPRVPPLHVSDLFADWRISSHSAAPAAAAGATDDAAADPAGRLAHAAGPGLDESRAPATTLGAALLAAAAHPGNHGVTYVAEDGRAERLTYSQLRDRALGTLAGLQAAGLAAGDKVILQLRDNRLFSNTYWACQLGGFVPAPVGVPPTFTEDSAALATLKHAWQLLQQPVVLTDAATAASLHEAARRLGLAGFRT